jgi:beta-mannosidase
VSELSDGWDSGAGWTVREALGRTWQWYVEAPLPAAGNNVADAASAAALAPGWLPARVPGSVVGALVRAGELPDPYVGRQSRAAEWTAERHWVYRRRLDPPPIAADERAVLELDGVDPGGRVFVDGTEVGRIGGLYRSFRVDVTDLLREPGPHRLAVVVDPVPDSEPQVGRTDAVRVHAPRMNYGWDFCPRFPHQGIWRPVRLRVGRLHVHDVVVATETSSDLEVGRVRVDATVDGVGEEPLVRLLDGGLVVAEGKLSAPLEVPRPRLWWPNRHGEQATYTLEIRSAGGPAPMWSGRTGFRTIRMLPNPDGPEDALPYTAEVNGVPVPLVGWNWAPADAQHGEVTAARVRHLVGLAAASGARLLRVWGGGLVETEELYDACDDAGLLVWQEFSQSASGFQNAPTDDPEFVALMRSEAEAVVPARRRHPSLLMWGGGNELDSGAGPADEAGSAVLAVLRETVAAADPGRHWVATSPSGPPGEHDVHGPWEHQGLVDHYRLHNSGTSLAHTEFGVEGMANTRAFEAVVPDGERWPCDRSNPVMRHLGEWWNNEPLVQSSFGHRLTDAASLRRASQLLQATGLQYAVEADRRRAPRCSMVLPWQLNESYPNAWCTAVVDHLGEPKPAYHAVARAFADDRVTLAVDRAVWPDRAPGAEVWLWSVAGVAAGSSLEVQVLDETARVLHSWSWPMVPAVGHPVRHCVVQTDPLPLAEGTVLFWEARWTAADGTVLDRTVETMTTGPDWSALLDLGTARVDTAVTRRGDRAASVEVTHRAGPAVVGLRLADARPGAAPGLVRYDGDPRPLLPRESRRFGVSWDDDASPRLRLEAFNLGDLDLDLDLDRSTP